MDFDHIDERFRRCSTLLQALLSVNSLGLPAGRIEVKSGKVHGIADFQSSRVTKVTLLGSQENGEAALSVLVGLKDAKCRFLAPGEEPKPDSSETADDKLVLSVPAADATASTTAKSEVYIEPADVMEETVELDPGVIAASPLKTGVRASLMREQLRRAVEADDFEDLIKRHKDEFNQVSGKLKVDLPADESIVSTGDPIAVQSEPGENGNAVIARAGFVLTDPNIEPPSVEKSLATCTSVLDALLTVGALGINKGFLEISGGGIKGTVQFRKRKLIKATIDGTEQSGEGALRTLMSLSAASCKYLPLPERAPQPIGDNFKVVGDAAKGSPAGVTPRKKTSKSAELLPHQRRNVAEEPVAELPPEGQAALHRAEFEQTEGRLDDIPVPRDVHYMPATPAPGDVDGDAIKLARVGFIWDFRDIDPESTGSFYAGDPSSIPIATYKISRTSKTMRKFVLPMVVIALCVSIYTVPAMLWKNSNSQNTDRRKQMQAMADTTYDSLEDGNAIRRRVFEMPKGHAGPIEAASAIASGEEVIDPEQIGNAGNDPSDILEFALANDAATLPRLEELIHKYIAKKNYRRARDLALAAVRSPFATPDDKERFFAIYKQCLHK